MGLDGQQYPLHSTISPDDGAFLHSLISRDTQILRTLEVGLAQGLSALYITDALRDRPDSHHFAIDPFQMIDFKGAGLFNLKEAGIDSFTWIDDKSEFALPELTRSQEQKFDLIFVDGWHTFDHTLIDCFYATRLLRVGGILVIDDLAIRPVKRCVEYLLTYPCYQAIDSISFPKLPSIKRRAAKLAQRLVPESTGREMIAPRLCEKIYGDNLTTMIALQKIEEDRRGWDWFREF